MIFIVLYNRQILELNYEVQVKILRIWSHLLKKSLMESFIFLCSEIPNYSHCLFTITKHDITVLLRPLQRQFQSQTFP